MVEFDMPCRVRYAETDRMGYVYYGNYAVFFEVARVETLRHLGIRYRDLEDQGILLPVTNFSIHYIKPACYDDEIIIRTRIPLMPGVRIVFEYETVRGNEVLNTASTTLVFIGKLSGRPIRCPQDVADKLAPHFQSV